MERGPRGPPNLVSGTTPAPPPRPFVLGNNTRTQLEVGRMASRTIERLLSKDSLRTKDGEPFLLPSLPVFGSVNSAGEKLGPFFLTKILNSCV
jgi:hypothetical protein